jgi:uncharacterized SAM-binding protein YcdF (DUF218 family)
MTGLAIRNTKAWDCLVCRLALVVSLLLVCSYVAVAIEIVQYGKHASNAPADAAVVLGAAAWGSRPSPVYRERILEAISLYKARQVHWIVLTGGSPQPGYPSEARVGRQFCISRGIPTEAMLLDETSRTTWQNLQQAKQLMAPLGIETVLLVSDPFHMRRAMSMAKDLGLRAQPAPTLSSRFRSRLKRAKFLWRETWLYLAYIVFGVTA